MKMALTDAASPPIIQMMVGAAMAVLGTITLLLHVPAWETAVRDSLAANQLLLPLLVAVAAVTGFVVQHHEISKHEAKSKGKAKSESG